ncbi:MAG: hypothetical protein LBP59_01620 [Planctomycetaceae bacterium]|nr:hypothetical protein [Planctomycetaceae bacterium]
MSTTACRRDARDPGMQAILKCRRSVCDPLEIFIFVFRTAIVLFEEFNYTAQVVAKNLILNFCNEKSETTNFNFLQKRFLQIRFVCVLNCSYFR